MKSERNSSEFSNETGKQDNTVCLYFLLIYFVFLFVGNDCVHADRLATTFQHILSHLASRGKNTQHIKIANFNTAEILPHLGDWTKIWSKALSPHTWQNGGTGLRPYDGAQPDSAGLTGSWTHSFPPSLPSLLTFRQGLRCSKFSRSLLTSDFIPPAFFPLAGRAQLCCHWCEHRAEHTLGTKANNLLILRGAAVQWLLRGEEQSAGRKSKTDISFLQD